MQVSHLRMALVFCMLLTLQGCKTVYGKAYTYLTLIDSTGAEISLDLQLMTPPETAPTLDNGLYPALLFVHGGAWEAGNKFGNGFDAEINTAAQKGYVAASINYRLATLNEDGTVSNPWPAQIQDVKCAVRWLRANAEQFRIDPARIGIMGISAGGHLALMAAEAPDVAEFESASCEHAASSEVSVAVSFSGIADMASTWNGSDLMRAKIVKLLDLAAPTNVTFNELDAATRNLIWDADPIQYIGQADVPVLIAHPANDFLVPMLNSQIYYDALMGDGRDAYLLRLDRGGHFTNEDGTAANNYSEVQMYRWFDRHLKGLAVDLPCGNDTACDVVVP